VPSLVGPDDAGPSGSTVIPGATLIQADEEEAPVVKDKVSTLLVTVFVVDRELLSVCLQGGRQRAQSRGGNSFSGSIPVEFLS